MQTEKRKVDVVIAGSGPGGATVGRQLARAGKSVLLLEKGRDLQHIGSHLAALGMVDNLGMSWTEEGLNIVRAMVTGGSTIVYCGAAMPPPEWLKSKYRVDLDRYVAETVDELHLQPLADEVIGVGATRLMEAANELGYGFEKFAKFIDGDKCKRRCGGTCMLGCPHGAKWTAREYLADMVAAGGELMARADVQHVTIEDGVATGLVAFTPRGLLEVEASTVVIAAGGLGTPTILQRSGLDEAGKGMFVDPLVFVTGVSRFPGTSLGPPMTVGTTQLMEDGILLSDLIDPWGMWLVMTALRNPSKLGNFLRYRKQLSIMVKIGDERQGYITMDGDISKPLTQRDRHRLNRGAAISRQILIKAGCDPRTIMTGPVRGAHPGATARIGEVVDTDLKTRIDGLYVSDASVLPEALDRPVVLTVIGLGKRLADHLLARPAAKA
jgi:choline dehydrogenase-like flavoprotein